MKNPPFAFLSSNVIKLIALVLMTVDHVGMLLFPGVRLLRCIGRLSMPLFAYMISEGCIHTKNRKKYLLRLFLPGIAFQAVYIIFERDFFFNVFITFSLAVILCSAWDEVKKMLSDGKYSNAAFVFFATALGIWVLTFGVNMFLSHVLDGKLSAFRISFDGGVFGMFLPFLIYIAPSRYLKLLAMAAGCLIISIDFGGIQYFSLLSVLIAFFYNGKRGNLPLKSFFYIYYPAHLAVLYGIDYILSMFKIG